ncbi:MAG TPA: lamin tail domain-containing protein, partial [Flavisolibacter sp.]|nr:lamin tail domain-containing protein [Flavisolibacter sp.]
MLRIIICVFLFLSFQADAQLTEDFSDGDFVKDPVWTATPGSWIINPSGQLQSANVTAGSTFQITTANELATETEWEFSLALLFNTSSANYVDVFLVASGSDLTSSKTTGYFVRIGNTQDEVSLYRKDADAPPVRLIDGVDGTTNKSSNTLRIRIIRDASDMFTLYTDPTGTGSTFRTEGQKEDHLYARSLFFGFLVKQSTSSFFQKHYINLVTIAPYKPDLTPPALVAATATSLQTLDLLFSEPVDPATALEKERYEVDGGIGNPAAVTPDPANQALLHLQFGVPFPNGGMQSINLSGISDLAGNRSGLLTASFHFYKPVPFDVIIDEVLADPSPAVQLPLAEWIEVKNRSGHDLDLKDWTLKAGTATSGKFPAYLLKTDSFVILCASTNLPALQRFGSVLAIPSFPTLNNEGEVLVLQTPAGEQMHRVGYQASWYNSAAKREGGWSLEMIDTEAPCLDAKNWMESSNPNGGTPGRVNSVNNQPVSRLPPALKEITLVTDTSLLLQFEEPLDSLFAASADHYSLTNGITVRSVQVSGPLFLEVRLQLSGPLQKGQSYTLQFMAADCKGNSGEQSKILGVPEVPLKQDLVINELLFDPPPSGSDYVEFYNNSHKVIELKDLKIAGRSAGGRLRSVLPVTTTSRLLFPGDYIVLTEDKDALQKQYLVKDPR